MLASLPGRHLAVQSVRFVLETLLLNLAGRDDLFPHLGAVGAIVRQLAEQHRRDFDVNVDLIQQRTTDSGQIAFDLQQVTLALHIAFLSEKNGGLQHSVTQSVTRNRVPEHFRRGFGVAGRVMPQRRLNVLMSHDLHQDLRYDTHDQDLHQRPGKGLGRSRA